jgi:hypothetical protein
VIVSVDTSVTPTGKSTLCYLDFYVERASSRVPMRPTPQGLYYFTTPMDTPTCDMSKLYKRKVVNGQSVAAEDIGYDTPCDYLLKAWGNDDQANDDTIVQRGRTLFLRKVAPELVT